MKSGRKKIIASVVIVIIASLLIYSLIPPVVNTAPANMHSGKTYYIYGNIIGIISFNGKSLISVNDSGSNVAVAYNGSTPAVGTHVLVHGKYVDGLYIQANSVTPWYLAL